MSYVGTNTGKRIDLLNPDPDQFTIEDIANNLSKICRFNGQLRDWYSVAEHSIHVAELVPKEFKLQALLHDASEGYICDIPTPLKRILGDAYSDIEQRIQGAIAVKFGVPLISLAPCVKQADMVMVVTERDALQESPLVWGGEYETCMRYPKFRREYHTPPEARRAFLQRFAEYTT